MATFSEIFGSYRTYCEEIEEAIEGLHQGGPVLTKNSAPSTVGGGVKCRTNQRTEKISKLVQYTSEDITTERTVIEAFTWSSIMILFANISLGLGSYLLAPFLPIFLGRVGAMLLASVGIPLYAHHKIKKTNDKDVTIRNELLSLTIIQGILVGYSINDLHLNSSPFAVFTPAVVMVVFTLISFLANENRALMLGIPIAAAVGVNLLLGYVTRSLTATYFLMSLSYAGIAAVIMLHMFKTKQNKKKAYVYQTALSCCFIISKGMFHVLFGICNKN